MSILVYMCIAYKVVFYVLQTTNLLTYSLHQNNLHVPH